MGNPIFAQEFIYMAKFHTLKVADVRRETADCVSVAFDIPENLETEFKFLPGQYLTLKIISGGEEIRRSYSICTSPYEKELRVAVKRVKDGKGSTYITEKLRRGDEIEVMTPMGNFHTPLLSTNNKQYVLFAGGSGITPMLSILKTVLIEEPGSTLILFYGNLNEESTIFRKTLNELNEKEHGRFQLYYIFDKPESGSSHGSGGLYSGVMSKEKVHLLLNKHVALSPLHEFFICGPTPMMDNVRETLEELKIEKPKIHIEYFTSALGFATKVNMPAGEKITSQVTVIQYGMETTFELSSDGKVILDAAMDAGVDAPFACKGAVCATCRGKLIEGKVVMEKNFALTDEDIADGYILTCQSHPSTPVVKVDYDG